MVGANREGGNADGGGMEITPEYASQIAQAEVGSKVSMAVAKKVMDQERAAGEAAIELLESAAKVGAAEQALRGGVDLYA